MHVVECKSLFIRFVFKIFRQGWLSVIAAAGIDYLPSARARNALKGLSVSTHKKSAIVKADRDPAIVTPLDYFPYFTLQRYFGLPGESLSDQPDPIANFETGLQQRFLFHFPLAFSPSSTRRRMASERSSFTP
jgi:hypothetical protein